MKRAVFLCFLALILIINLLPLNTFALDELPDINPKAYMLIDSGTGQILASMNPDMKLYPASTTKILTAVLALENGKLDSMMNASQAAVNDIGPDGMNIGIMPGENLKMEDLLNALLIQSANETANILAENVGPTRQGFVDMMNKRASEMGALNTHFANPCGAHNPNHYTTARDMAVFARYAMAIPKFREIVARDTYKMTATNKHSNWNPIFTTNKLLKYKSPYFEKITGIKTGYTSQAGFNLVTSAVNKQGVELISVVMGVFGDTSKTDVIKYSKELLNYGFKNYSRQNYMPAGKVVATLPVTDAKKGAQVELITKTDFETLLPVDRKLWGEIKAVNHLETAVKAPVKAGDVLGFVEFEKQGVKLGRVDVVARNSIEKNILSSALKNTKSVILTVIKKILIMMAVVIVGFLALRFTLRKISRRVKAKRRESIEQE